MQPSGIKSWIAGDLVQVRKGVFGVGEVGIVVGPDWQGRDGLLRVLFAGGTKLVHSSNLQKPDGRTRKAS